MTELINDDMSEWSAKLIDISTSADTLGMVPPSVDSLPPVAVTEWENLRPYVRLGGLRNVALETTRADQTSTDTGPCTGAS